MPRLLLIRHGESEWNAVGRWQGQADPPLSERGLQQAEAAARMLGTFESVTASPLRRAADTAVIIAAELGVGPVPTDPDLMERDAGPWQGLTRDEIEAGWPGHLDSGTRPEGYEDDVALMGRVGAGLGRVVARTESEALVVTHGGVIYALEKACGEPWTRIANLAGRWIEWLDGGLALGPRIEPITDGTVPDLP